MSNTFDRFSVESVYAELLARAPENKIEPRMEPMRRAMEILGEPNKAFPIIHVTGTNGKTSTARMIESLLRAHDLRTGRYSSPHLVSVTERIAIDGESVDDETFVRIWDEIRPYLQIVDDELAAAGENRLTYFEAVTILGFAVFADTPVDVAIIEVGLGGITDATNVGDGQVSVVTPISLDHTDLLGDTTELIAEEKAGIIKPGGFLVSSAQPADAAQVLLDRARELERALPVRGRRVRRREPHRRRRRPAAGPPGPGRALSGHPAAAARRAPGTERGRRTGRRRGIHRRRGNRAEPRPGLGGLRRRHQPRAPGGHPQGPDRAAGRRAQPRRASAPPPPR